jgi:hypothetical protein
MTVMVIDHGWDELRATLDHLRRRDAYVKAGVIGKAAEKVEEEHTQGASGEAMTNVRLAMIHEFGAPTVNIPERSFIRATFNGKRTEYVSQLRRLVKGVYQGKSSVRTALNIMGFKMKWDQKNRILQGAGIPPPLAPSTVLRKERKGKWRKTAAKDPTRPLVDTGVLVRAIDHAVVLHGGKSVPLPGGGLASGGGK